MRAAHKLGRYSERIGGGMPTISNDEVEAEARALLRERVEHSPWFWQAMSDRERLTGADREGGRRLLAPHDPRCR